MMWVMMTYLMIYTNHFNSYSRPPISRPRREEATPPSRPFQ